MVGKVVELAGTSGAGKSSIAQLVAAEPSAQPVQIAPLCAPWWLLWGASRNLGFVFFCFAQIFKRKVSIGFSLRLLGNVLRSLGRFECARSSCIPGALILLDEGPTNLAQTIFAVGSDAIEPEDVRRFCALCPRTPYLVLLKAELSTLIHRASTRSDPPIKNAPPEVLVLFLERCQLVFEVIADSLRPTEPPPLIVETNSKQELDDAVKRISEWIKPSASINQRNYS